MALRIVKISEFEYASELSHQVSQIKNGPRRQEIYFCLDAGLFIVVWFLCLS